MTCPWCGKQTLEVMVEIGGELWPFTEHERPWEGARCPGPQFGLLPVQNTIPGVW